MLLGFSFTLCLSILPSGWIATNNARGLGLGAAYFRCSRRYCVVYADTRGVGSSKGEGTDSKVQWLEFPYRAELEVEVERDTVRLLRCLRYRGRLYESIVMLLSVILHGPRRGEEIGLAGGENFATRESGCVNVCVALRTVEAGLGPPGIYAKENRFAEVNVQNSLFLFFSFISLFSSSG